MDSESSTAETSEDEDEPSLPSPEPSNFFEFPTSLGAAYPVTCSAKSTGDRDPYQIQGTIYAQQESVIVFISEHGSKYNITINSGCHEIPGLEPGVKPYDIRCQIMPKDDSTVVFEGRFFPVIGRSIFAHQAKLKTWDLGMISRVSQGMGFELGESRL